MFPTLILSVILLTANEETLAKARALIQSQDYNGAVALLEPLVKAEPDNAQAWLSYGRALQKQGDLDKALEAHQKAVRFEETKYQGMYNTAVTFALKDDVVKAFECKRPLPPCSRYVAPEASFVCSPLEAGDEGGKRCRSEGQRGYRK